LNLVKGYQVKRKYKASW